WYPVVYELPQIRMVVNDLLGNLPAVELGGVLITRIPPGGEVKPHVDHGWHASYYRDKYAVQLRGNEHQAFHFEDASLSAEPGEVYWFDNSRLHWVTNESDEERITMIVCTRRKT
ncbi:MAG: aspartyl/asparaginyl beta-hydroxylase domain-containing protein, partial [Pseudohongiellaceae bacterium]